MKTVAFPFIRNTRILALTIAALTSAGTWAQAPAAEAMKNSTPARASVYTDPVFYLMCFVAFILLIFIMQMSKLFSAVAREYARKQSQGNKSLLIALVLGAGAIAPQQAYALSINELLHRGLGSTVYNILAVILIVEVIVMLYYASMIRKFIQREKEPEPFVEKSSTRPFWDRFNRSVAVEQEAAILTDHNYDGIQELDNSLPPWWKYGFYLTIVWALVYLVHYHVLGTGPLMIEELNIAEQKAQQQLEEFKKKSANFVDENSVKLLTEAADLAVGKSLFTEKTCIACHGKDGQGGTGPNLTDDYWIHGGSVQDIFKTIKYGVPEKGMIAWANQITPLQMAQLTSFIKSLRGTNPPNPKEPQGTLWSEPAPGDSTQVNTTDTVKTTAAMTP